VLATAVLPAAALPTEVSVLIAGGGPFGLMLANELGRRGITALLVDAKEGTTRNVQANATQARTMEHYRRLGFADEVRALGMPADFPTDIAYFTRFAGRELARFSLPSARDARQLVRTLSGSWSAAELPHRCNQKFIEPVLRRHAERLAGVSVRYGWRMTRFEALENEVRVRVEPAAGGPSHAVRARYLVGADGPRSPTRQALGIRYAGETGVTRDFVGGRMYAVYCRIPAFYRDIPHAPAWMNVNFNRERRCFMPAVDGRQEFAFHTQLKPHEDEARVTDESAVEMVRQAIGAPLAVEVLARDTWTAGHSLVAERFGAGRVFIGGDAAHLFTPTGGLGYNTAVEDAVNLGWKLAAVLKGQAAPRLLESYDAERRPLAVRNTSYAKAFADSLGIEPPREIEEETAAGEAARRQAGEYLARHGAAEFNIPGITFGGRYDDSPAIVPDGSAPPPDRPNVYVPTACPGGRPPHLWLDDARSLFDAFGFEWTLLRLGKADGAGFERAARAFGLDLTVLDVRSDEAHELYGAELALIRPDQVVAWRGDDDGAAESVLARLNGRG
jgi:2-polyprenyl-6-methoxyphenol hydroxylase-like FAD-dependent oxidoreductase